MTTRSHESQHLYRQRQRCQRYPAGVNLEGEEVELALKQEEEEEEEEEEKEEKEEEEEHLKACRLQKWPPTSHVSVLS